MQDRGSSGATFSKLLQRPDVFRPKDREEELTLWYEWAWTFKQSMLAVSPEIHGHLLEIEKDLGREMDEFEVSDDAMALSNKLYAVLTTMLRERPLQLLRSVPNNNGFEAWRVLHTTLAPTSKTRALALLGAISQYPNMSQGNLLEQLLKMEDLFEKYEQAVKPALLLRVLPQSVKSHLTVSITDESTCDQMREVILRWERSSQKWCSQIVTGSVQFKNQPSDDGGLAPMDVDRVKASGAIKARVAFRAKVARVKTGNRRVRAMAIRRGMASMVEENRISGTPRVVANIDSGTTPRARTKGERRGRKEKAGGGKLHPDACRICGKRGHWGNECWMKDNVRYISESPTSAATPSTTSVPSTASSVAPSVKRVFNLEADSSDDARDAPLTTIFEMASESSEVQSVAESEWWCRVVQHFEVHRDDDLAVIDCSLEGYACHDLTMFDAYEADYVTGVMVLRTHQGQS